MHLRLSEGNLFHGNAVSAVASNTHIVQKESPMPASLRRARAHTHTQRRCKESSHGVCQPFLCRASPPARGAQRRAVQSGGTQSTRNSTTAKGRARALHTTPAVRQGHSPGNSAAVPAAMAFCVARNHRQCSTFAAVGRGVRHYCPRHHTGHPPLPVPPRTQGRVRAAGLRTPGGGGPLS